MKNRKLFALAFALVLVGGSVTFLSSCDSSSSQTSEAPSISEVPSTSEVSQFIDYASSDAVRLKLDYKNRDFYKDGVAEVTLRTSIDGDTAHFTPLVTTTSSETIKARFYGIDTPESTGKIQEYGKPASNFTKEQLKLAADKGTIVVSSPTNEYKVPEHDSTGTRYVCLVWINTEVKNASYDSLKLLNLMIVQEGLSYVKNVSDIPEYTDTFYAAEEQAKNFKKNLWSGEPDPTFNYGGYEDVSLLDMKLEIEKSLKDPTHVNKFDNAKVRIVGTVAGFSNNILYLQNYYTKEQGARFDEGEYAGINIFTGMSAIPSKYTTKNTYIQLCGTATDSENFGFQISGASFPVKSKDENDAKVLIKPEDNTDEFSLHTFNYKASELTNSNNNYTDLSALNCSVKIEDEVKVRSIYKASNSEITLYLDNLPFQIYITFMYRGDPDNQSEVWSEESYFKDHYFKVQGVYTYHKTSSGKINFQINPSNSEELIFVR